MAFLLRGVLEAEGIMFKRKLTLSLLLPDEPGIEPTGLDAFGNKGGTARTEHFRSSVFRRNLGEVEL